MKQGDYNKLVYDIKTQYPEQTRKTIKKLEAMTGLKFNGHWDDSYQKLYSWVKNEYIPKNDKTANFEIQNTLSGVDIAGNWTKISPFIYNYIIKHFYDEYETLKKNFNVYAINTVIHLANRDYDLDLKRDEITNLLDSEIDDYLLNKIYVRDERHKYENQIVVGKKYEKISAEENKNTIDEKQ